MATTRKSAAKKSAARKASKRTSPASKKTVRKSAVASKKTVKKAAASKKTAKKTARKAAGKSSGKALKKSPVRKTVKKAAKKAAAKRRPASSGASATSKALTKPATAKRSPTGQKVAHRTPAAKPDRDVKKPAQPKNARATGSKASPPAENNHHISPEEAVAHIQALLKAKQERVKQGPTWPGAGAVPHGDNGDLHGHAAVTAEDPVHNHISHARGDQLKGKS